jgi:lysophospholipase L1-like esterase
MNKMKKLVLFLIFVGHVVMGQHAFEKEILDYEKQDSIAMPAKGQKLFIGSSSFRLWKTFPTDMAGIPAINRGFGGSTLVDALYYFDRMVVKYEPSWVFLYEGDNDLWKNQSPEEIAAEYKLFSEKLAIVLPQTKLVYVSIRPSLARQAMVHQQKALNAIIATYSKGQKNRFVLDMHSPFYLPDGTLMQDIFVADRLHLNEKGYPIFALTIKEFIKRNP